MIIKYGKIIWGEIKKEVRLKQHKQTFSPNPLHDDIYLVEFPKSGITWLSFLLANLILLKNEKREKVTFYNYSRYIPDIHQLRGAEINKLEDYRFIKSHSEYNPLYNSVVYILRNPIDVMVSYYNYLQDHGASIEFEKFVKSEKFGIKTWGNHVNSWLNNSDKVQKIHLIKYEDLQKNALASMTELCLNLGIDVEEETIKKAILNSDLKSMKESEELYRKNNPSYNVSFVGKTNKKKKEELITPKIKDYIISESHTILEKYYNPDTYISRE